MEWKRDSEAYTPTQVEAVLRACGVDVEGETGNDFLCFCPFHGNRHSPSFSVSRRKGTWICFNHACGLTGTLLDLVVRIPTKDGKTRNQFEARRLIIKKGSESQGSLKDELEEIFKPVVDFLEFPQVTLDRMSESFWRNDKAKKYMTERRGFLEETLRYFDIGYSAKKDIIAVPMHTDKGVPVGVIGRPASHENKFFKNSKGLPTSKTLWNLHRAKRTGGTVIVTEASFDAMRVHQAGYPNVVSCLGGNFSKYHFEQLNRMFDSIVIMTDFDNKQEYFYQGCRKCKKRGSNLCLGHNPGRDLGATIAGGLQNKRIMWASFEEGMVYPHGAKDAGDMTDDEIRQCLRNAVPDYEYAAWGLY